MTQSKKIYSIYIDMSLDTDNENDLPSSVEEDDDASINEPHLTSQHSMIEQLTLELLMNKSHYHKYMANADPENHEKHVQFRSQISKYKHKIISITNELISSQTKQITTDVNDAFIDYVKTLINYFQMKDIENTENISSSNEEDTMFGGMDTDNNTGNDNNDNGSLWGGHHVVKRKTNNINNFMHGFPRK